ncbi:MAG: EamA family transporter [Candidatus Bathyarchaeia archaeon]
MELIVYYVIITSFLWSIFTFTVKYILSSKMKNFVSFIYLQGILVIFMFPLLSFILVPDQIFFPPIEVVPYALVSGGTSILAYLLMYYGLTKYDASSAAPIVSIQSIFVIPLSFIFLGEYYGPIVTFWILIAIIGAVMTSWDEKIKIKQLISPKNKALWIFLMVSFLYASGNVAVKPALGFVSNFNFLIWRQFAWFAILVALMPLIFHQRERRCLVRDWKGAIVPLSIVIFLQFFGYALMFYAFGISVQITTGLMATTGLFAVIIGFLLSKSRVGFVIEKHNARIYLMRLMGALLILFAIYGLSLILAKF